MPAIKRVELLTATVVALVGIVSAIYLYSIDGYSLLYYGDSISHLVAGRKLVDWHNPGISQLGTVWLPLLHFVLIPAALNDFLFTSGFAGTAVSLPSLMLASFYMTKIVHLWYKSEKLALFGGLIFALNPSIIYMGIVSMQESLFLFLAVSSAYHTYVWYDAKSFKHLYIASVLTILATLTRYEGWFLPLALIVLATARMIKTENRRAELRSIVSAIASFGGIAFWLLWNLIAFGDMLAFLNIPFYSYLAQATSRPFRESLFLQPLSSASILFTAMEVMYGAPLLIMTLIGLFFVIREKRKGKLVLTALLALPLVVVYASLVFGVGEIFHQGGGIWFNSRFLVLASGLISFASISILDLPKKKTTVVAISTILILSALFGAVRQFGYPNPPMVMKEAYAGFSYRNETFSAIEVAKKLQQNYNEGTTLMLTSSGDAHKIMVFSGIHLVNFRDLFAGEPWPLVDGARKFNEFVIVSNRPSGDAILAARFIENNSVLLNEKYEIIYHNEFFTLMKLIEP